MELNLLDLFKHVKNPQDFTAGETIEVTYLIVRIVLSEHA